MTKKENKEKRAEDILDAAVAEFIEKGYENSSMDRIAMRAGLTKGGLYYHFTSKDDILVKANERFMEPVAGMISQTMSMDSAPDALRCFIKSYLSYWSQHSRELSFVFLSMTKALSIPELGELYKGCVQPMLQFYSEMYARGVSDGDFRQMDCDAGAVALLGALDGIIGYLALDQGLDLELTIGRFQTAFVNSFIQD